MRRSAFAFKDDDPFRAAIECDVVHRARNLKRAEAALQPSTSGFRSQAELSRKHRFQPPKGRSHKNLNDQEKGGGRHGR
jgi:hypothetical protein